MTCLTDEQLEQLASGGAGNADAERLMAHVERCASCARRLRESRLNLALVAELEEAFPSLESELGDLNASDLLSSTPDRLDRLSSRSVPPGSIPPADSIPGYEIVREIHRGGQGVVYEAVQLSTKRTVAVKVMLEGPFASERSRWRFEREVELVARLRHPNIVAIHDSGIAEGRYYFAMDYVRGQPLDTHIRLSRSSIREIVGLVAEVCDAVSYAHRRGIIHRDLKPSNILVGEDGKPQVLDFGLAKIADSAEQRSRQELATIPGQILGTLAYMSPEQAVGDPETIDTGTDVYTIGVIFYELLTGDKPYQTNDVDLSTALKNIQEVDPPRPSRLRREINSELDTVVLKAMHKDSSRRYRSAGEFGQDLHAYLEGRPVTAKSDSSFYVLRKLAVRHSFESLVVATLIVALVAFATIALQGVLYGQRMQAERDMSDAAFQGATDTLRSADAGAKKALRDLFLGWFLMEWHGRRLDRARDIRNNTIDGTPVHAAMTFLLDSDYTVDRLEAALGDDMAPLRHYVVGERHLQAGDIESALASFEKCVDNARAKGDRWWESAGQARLAQIRSVKATSDTSASVVTVE